VKKEWKEHCTTKKKVGKSWKTGLSPSMNVFTSPFMPNSEKTSSMKTTILPLLDTLVDTKLQTSSPTITGGPEFNTMFENTLTDVRLAKG